MKKYNVLSECIKKILLISLIFASSANASLILNIDEISGELIGASNVDVNGILYDVKFVEGSVDEIFGSSLMFDANSKEQAHEFSTALLNQLFFIDPPSKFDLYPNKIYGCFDTESCGIVTPYLIETEPLYNQTFVRASGALNGADAQFADYLANFYILYSESDSSLNLPFDYYVYADWSLSIQVPEPSSLMILLIATFGLSRRLLLHKVT